MKGRPAPSIFSVLAFTACIYSVNVKAQVTPPDPYSGSIPVSFIRTWNAVAPEATPNSLMTRPLKDVKQTTTYFDGLGRPMETVAKQASLETTSGANADMVSASVYDQYRREVYKYLPFAANNTGGNTSISDGLFKLNPFQQQISFYNTQLTGQTGETNVGPNSLNYAYAQTSFEQSPLNRSLENFAPGVSWVGTSTQALEANRTSIKIKQWVNTATDDVKIWTVTDVANNWGTYAISGAYPAGTLMKSVTVDERNNQVIEFKDKEGQVILKKVQLTATDNGMGSGYTGWLNTYYIYDNLNNLRCVIQPKGVELISSNWLLTDATILAEQCFRYEYDARNRMIRKKVPGAGEVWMVYDARDRLVMTQDANLRNQQKWMYTVYDNNLNLPLSTGLITDATNYNNLTYHLQNAYSSTTYPNLSNYPGYEELTTIFYDNYTWLSSYGNPLPSSYSTIYDSYFQTPSNNWPYPQANAQSAQIKGLSTGTRIKILGTSTYLYTVNFYDNKGRAIQAQSTNITGGTDIVTTQYTWAGQGLVAIQKQQKVGTNAQTSTIVSQLTYDDLGRLIKTEKKAANTLVNGGSMPAYKTTAQLQYDKLGQLKIKTLGAAPLETLNYDYNVRGWMLGMNRNFVSDVTNTNYFGFDLGFDKNGVIGTYTPQYNGNISGTVWKSKGDNEKRKYDFTYDAVNRLTAADFNQWVSGSGTSAVFNKSANVDFSVSNLTFDANGNILTMNQKGWKVGGSSFIDQLSYSYITNINKLLQVSDASNDNTSRLGDFKYDPAGKTSTDYNYDANGNLSLDNNKKISSITYNHLNLPSVITVTGKGTIAYTYDAAGNKLKKVTTEGSIVTTTLYVGGVIYVNDTLQFIGHEEGRVRFNPTNNTLQYDYFLKDHLGNVRMVLTEEQKTDAYPAATMETGSATTEETYYANLPATRVTVPAGYPANTPPSNARVAKVNGSGNKIGPAIVLKIMAGDKFNLIVNSWWTGSSPGTPISPLTDLVSALNNSLPPISGGHATSSELNSNGTMTPPLTSFLNSQSYDGSKPKAFINWILFDERFNYVSSSSGFEQIGISGNYTTHTRTNLALDKSGYLYVYVSNETPNIDVFFDNLQVTHIRGPLLEETHYYPFGLTMAGISSKALNFGNPENKYKFNDGTELNTALDVGLYETNFRSYDPQIGRFVQTDELGEEFEDWSPYIFGNDNPILFNDPTGLFADGGDEPTGKLAEVKTLSEVVLAPVKAKPKPLTIINSPGVGFRKNPNYNPFNNYSPSYFKYQAWSNETINQKMTVWDAVENISIFVPWGRVFKGIKWLYTANKARQVLKVAMLARFVKLASFEQKIVTEANLILNSKNLSILRTAFEKGISAEVSVGGRTILYEPSLSASGLTLFSENGFVLGREAFVSNSELGKTVLHELYRLTNSVVQTGGATGATITTETNAAFQFANKTAEFLKF